MLQRCSPVSFNAAVLLFAATALAAGVGQAQAPNDVTLSQALQAAAKAPDREVARRKTVAAQRGADAAGAWPATELILSTTLRSARFVPALRFPLPVWGTLAAERERGRAEAIGARQEEASALLELRRGVRQAWIELRRAQAVAELAEQAAQRQQELASISAHLFEAGSVPRSEVVASEAQSRRARAEAAAAQAAIGAASAGLAGILGWQPDAAVHAAGELPEALSPPPLSALLARAHVHPRVRVADAKVEALGARVDLAQRQRFPQLALDMEANIHDPTLPGSDLRAGLALSLPLLGRTDAVQHAAEAERDTASAERAAAEHSLAAQIVSAYRDYEAARGRSQAMHDDVLPAQREAARLARASYQQGHQGLVGVLQAERTLAETERAALDAQADAALAQGELEWSSGVWR